MIKKKTLEKYCQISQESLKTTYGGGLGTIIRQIIYEITRPTIRY